MNFAIANHTMTIVQVEGTNVEPLEVKSVDLSSGQRYDVLVTMNQTPGSYLMQTSVRLRSIPLVKGMAILQYSSIPNVTFPKDQVPDHAKQDDPEYGPNIDGLLLTRDPKSHPQASALNCINVSRYVVAGTQGGKGNWPRFHGLYMFASSNDTYLTSCPQRLLWTAMRRESFGP
jgi:FtsP/CotA-like multicopper oxidase with cupredoxin domain